MAKNKTKRTMRKDLRKGFERRFDLNRLDYQTRVQPLKPKALLSGILTAAVLYGLGYAAAYYGWSYDYLPMEGFAKLVWVMMVPTTVVGVLVWQIAKNRMEYPIRQDIRTYITELERPNGLLWRYAPALPEAAHHDMVTKKAMALSQQGKPDKIDVEDYTRAVQNVYAALSATDKRDFASETIEEIERNLAA